MERVHQRLLNMLVTTDPANKVFDYIDPWVENLESISWAIGDSYHHTIQETPGQASLGVYIIFNTSSVVYRQVITAGKHQQVGIYNVQ